MSILDIIILVILCFFGYKGFKNGLVKELGSLIALVAGVFLALRFSEFVASTITKTSGFSSEYLPIISFAVIFIGVVILVLVFAKLLNQFMKLIKLQWLNKSAGTIFSILKTVIILGGLFFMICRFNERMQLFDAAITQKSFLFDKFIKVFEFIFPYVEHLYPQ
jgi:membrane protein required for colicin V production